MYYCPKALRLCTMALLPYCTGYGPTALLYWVRPYCTGYGPTDAGYGPTDAGYGPTAVLTCRPGPCYRVDQARVTV